MMPLSMANVGENASIKGINGDNNVRHFLESLGFVIGADVKVVNKNGGNVIVSMRESRVAISREMAVRIMVQC